MNKVKGKLIYLLEDDQDIRQLIQMLLSRHGHSVTAFGTADAFKEQIQQALPDLCILDVTLPDGNGLDICLELSASPFTSQVPVLLMSANPIQRNKYQQSGAWRFINKPFNAAPFLEMVNEYI